MKPAPPTDKPAGMFTEGTMSDRTLNAIRRRFEKWELEHLRKLAAELHERCERAEDEARRAWESAEFWQQNAMELQETLMAEDFTIGLTKEGQLFAIKPAEEQAS
mgnify:CR=1 FL=1